MSSTPVEHPRARFRQAAELLAATLAERAPADRIIDSYFRAHRVMGARDRAFAAETTYGCLRHRRVLEQIVAGVAQDSATVSPRNAPIAPGAGALPSAAERLVAAYVLREAGWQPADLERAGYAGNAAALARAASSIQLDTLPLPVRANLTDAMGHALVTQFGERETLALAEALDHPAPLDIRVNPLKATRAQLQERLRAEGIQMEPTPLSPWGLRRADRAALFRCASFREGWFEVQDEGSQLIALLLQAQPHERVVDFCAGAGGKTLQLGVLLNNTGVVYATDVSTHRLQELKPRLRRSGLQNVRIVPVEHERDRWFKRLAGKIDRVLVDAPCSGSGTLRRNPDLKWKPLHLDELHARQLRILSAAARLVRKGGRLVYATCSVLRRENQQVVSAFLNAHAQFARRDAVAALAAGGVRVADAASPDGDLVLLPHRHGTDGFFAAVLERAERAPRIEAATGQALVLDHHAARC